ncbi:hypothetical protein ACM26V_04330 [Salipaludibacillus sp. HK11]|uniref:hypothetical protein n=1 Tax=Salipaludibacillus sp. HK11 TaxID=3394320 RepID=UPI0039FCC657
MELDDLHVALLQSIKNTYTLMFEWENGLKFKGKVDTSYETDNGLEMDEPGYVEYYACAVEIQEIINQPELVGDNIKVGNLIEVSIYNDLLSVSKDDGTVIWYRNK